MPALAESRQDRRRTRTRDSIIAAAEALFAARGADAVSVDEIVGAADVAKGSFYNHFEDKAALAQEIARSVRAAVEREVDARNEGVDDPAARTARALCVYMRFARQQPARAKILSQLVAEATGADARLNRGLRDDVTSGLETGRFTTMARGSLMNFIMGVTIAGMQWIGEERVTATAMRARARDLVTLKLQGLGLSPDEARAIADGAVADIFQGVM